jgi:Flp pilus assembly pilin Flp
MARPSMRSGMTTFRGFLAAESGGAGLEFAIVAAGVGLALSAVLHVVGGVVVAEFEAVDNALKHQNRY